MSTNSIDQAVLNQVKNLEEKTGKKMQEWMDIANQSGFEKHGEILSFLKTKHGLGHGYANLVVHYARQSHSVLVENSSDLVAEQYKGKENLKSWYDRLVAEVKTFGNDVEISPKKAYVSLRRKKQFALIQPSLKTRMDVGLNLKGVVPPGNAEAAGTWNSMCSHRVKVENEQAINKELISLLKMAYDQAG